MPVPNSLLMYLTACRCLTGRLSTAPRCLEYLLRNDANPAIRDKQGYNAVHYASAYGHRLCLELVRSAVRPTVSP